MTYRELFELIDDGANHAQDAELLFRDKSMNQLLPILAANGDPIQTLLDLHLHIVVNGWVNSRIVFFARIKWQRSVQSLYVELVTQDDGRYHPEVSLMENSGTRIILGGFPSQPSIMGADFELNE